jgi:hypothetical protein
MYDDWTKANPEYNGENYSAVYVGDIHLGALSKPRLSRRGATRILNDPNRAFLGMRSAQRASLTQIGFNTSQRSVTLLLETA